MQYQEGEQSYFYSAYQEVSTHKMGCFAEAYTAIVVKYLCVNVAVHYEECNKKETRKGHLQFLTYRRAERLFPVHEIRLYLV